MDKIISAKSLFNEYTHGSDRCLADIETKIKEAAQKGNTSMLYTSFGFNKNWNESHVFYGYVTAELRKAGYAVDSIKLDRTSYALSISWLKEN